MVLGLSRLRSEEASGEMQVSRGLDTKNCRRKHILPFISVFCVRVCFYVCLRGCVCVCVCESNSVPKRSKPFVASSMLFFLQGDTGSP